MKERTALWDNLKFFLIVLVVIGHFAGQLTSTYGSAGSMYIFIYSFHMPLFIFVSGLFYKPVNTGKKVLFYISCGFAIKIALAIANMVNGRAAGFQLLSDGGLPWFMFTLAIYQAVMYYLNKVLKSKKSFYYLLFGCVILACFLGYDKTISDYLYLSRSIIFFPFFLLGTLLDEEKIRAWRRKYARILIPVAIIIILAWAYLCVFHLKSVYIYRHLFTGRNPFNDKVVDYGALARLLCYGISSLMCFSLVILCPDRKIPLVTIFGGRTLNVYFWHNIILGILIAHFGLTTLYSLGVWGKLLYLFIAVLLSFILSLKIFDFPLLFIRKMCYSDNDNKPSEVSKEIPVEAKQSASETNG